MSFETLIFEKRRKLALITLNRPEKLNALNATLIDELGKALGQANGDADVRVIVLKGAGSSFCAGYDITDPKRLEVQLTIADDRSRLQTLLNHWLSCFWDSPKPVIAQVHGYCVAGGAHIASLCDLTVVADNAQITPQPPSGPLGAGYAAAEWTYTVGPKKAKELYFRLGKFMDGREAERAGWANKSVPLDKLEEEVLALADDVAKLPTELLILNKLAINKTVEGMGFRHAVMDECEIDAIAHLTKSVTDFVADIRTKGLRQAVIDWERSQADV